MENESSFEVELQHLINNYSIESLSNTPDFILASFLRNVLTDWNHAINARDRWYGHQPFSVVVKESSD